MNVPTGQTVTFEWLHGPHTVTQSSAELICNKSLAADSFGTTGPQNASFTFDVTVKDDSQPLFFYCGIIGHCEKGMFGILNPTQANSSDNSMETYISSMASKDSSMAQMVSETSSICEGNSEAMSWGSTMDVSMFPEWAKSMAAQNVLQTRQFIAQSGSQKAAVPSSSSSISGTVNGPAPTGSATDAAASSGAIKTGVSLSGLAVVGVIALAML